MKIANNIFNQKYGLAFAERVAEYLVKKKDYIGYVHRDYYGTGFTLHEKIYYHTHFYDGYSDINREYDKHNPRHGGIINSFITKDEFINWLSAQTDKSLSGGESSDSWYRDNQRITKERLNVLLNNKEIAND